ncbi:hypothetical protein Tco_0580606 [Tanacetum coccineum]
MFHKPVREIHAINHEYKCFLNVCYPDILLHLLSKSLYAKRPPPSWTINHLRVNENIVDRPIGVDESHLCLPDRVMSSPSYPTSNIEDAFSSKFLDYISASPDYVPMFNPQDFFLPEELLPLKK